MYKIYCGDYLLEDPRLEDYILGDSKLSEEINKVDKLEFTIYDTHPNKNKLENLVPNIKLTKNDVTIFKGRIYKTKENIDKSKQVYVESVLAFLNDTIQEPFSFQGSAADLFSFLISNYNTQVNDSSRQFTIGLTTGANLDNNDYVNRSSEEYLSTWEAIETRILSIGGYIYISYNDDDTLTINWVDDFTIGDSKIVSGQTIEFGENLIDIVAENTSDETYSVIMPLGAEIDNGDGTKSRLDISSVNDGSKFLINQDALNKYGWRVMLVSESTFDDVTVAANLKTKGEELLNNQGVMLKSTLDINASDLSALNKNIDDFSKGEYVRVVSTPHNLSGIYLLTKKDTPLKEPNNITIRLGEEKATLTGIQFNNSQNTKDLQQQINIIGANSVTKEEVSILKEEITVNLTDIQKNNEEIVMTALEDYTSKSEFETYQEQVATDFIQTAKDFTFNFNNTSERITKVDGEIQQEIQERNSFIKLVDGNVVIGVDGSELTLVQKNDRISFIQNNNEVAYFSNQKLYVTDGEFLNSLIIGNFAFKPRTNGNLSLLYVGGEQA